MRDGVLCTVELSLVLVIWSLIVLVEFVSPRSVLTVDGCL